MPDRDISLKGYGTKLDEWEEKLVDLKARAQEVKSEQKAIHVEKIENLHHKTRQLRDKLGKIEDRHEVDLEKEIKEIDHALKDLDEEYRQTWVHFYH